MERIIRNIVKEVPNIKIYVHGCSFVILDQKDDRLEFIILLEKYHLRKRHDS